MFWLKALVATALLTVVFFRVTVLNEDDDAP
jgi:hypothetical protein